MQIRSVFMIRPSHQIAEINYVGAGNGDNVELDVGDGVEDLEAAD